jgi:hypothetical protein
MGPNNVGWHLLILIAVHAPQHFGVGGREACPLRRSCDYAAAIHCVRRNCMEDLRPGDDRAKNYLTNFC